MTPDEENLAAQARRLLAGHAPGTTGQLGDALDRLYAEGTLTGAHVAADSLQGAVRLAGDLNNLTSTVDWPAWTPGDPQAAQLLTTADGGPGLAQLLSDRGIVLAGIDNTTLDDVSEAMARSLLAGRSVDDTMRAVDAVIDDRQRAELIARTETARAMSLATVSTYQENGVSMVEWLDEDGCPICAENADAGPIPLGEPFPSGDLQPPAHPNCLCALSASIEDAQ